MTALSHKEGGLGVVDSGEPSGVRGLSEAGDFLAGGCVDSEHGASEADGHNKM